ncbi:MAG: hypothetical protein A2V85_15025 [Chloroflexi bacterium RBG_16_72_14]|nr:MAG: hypothetical protein A2V85_15025 [Chloroflexi bacterium RBG_16_72_14]
MAGRKRTELEVAAARRNAEQLARLATEVREARRRRRLTQAALGGQAGVSRASVSRLERGRGGGLTLDAWQRMALAVGRPLIVRLQQPVDGETEDAGHLAIQELVLRFGRGAGYRGLVELATKPAEPWRSVDVALVDDARRRLAVVECWNSIGDVGAAARSSARKASEAEAMAATRWGERDHRVGSVWVVRATARNRALVARYPEVFAARFPGSSQAWLTALTTQAPPPSEPGLVWASVDGTRLFAWRRHR